MKQTWAVGISASDPRTIETISSTGQHSLIDLKAAIKDGVPTPKRSGRLVFEGEFSAWAPGSAKEYLAGLGMGLPEGVENQHEVFTMVSDRRWTIHVPALVLMRAFFKPHPLVFPALYTPVGVDYISFVDYSATPPSVVIDGNFCGNGYVRNAISTDPDASQGQALRWLQLSKSAKQASQSIYQHALSGRLSMSLPSGRVRMVFHGPIQGKHLYATKATLVSVDMGEHDSITGASEKFAFHPTGDPDRIPKTSIRDLTVPANPSGGHEITDAEWEAIEPMLVRKMGKPKHSQREILNVIFNKLVSGVPWNKAPMAGFKITTVTSAFHYLVSSGRMDQVLTYLEGSRGKYESPGRPDCSLNTQFRPTPRKSLVTNQYIAV